MSTPRSHTFRRAASMLGTAVAAVALAALPASARVGALAVTITSGPQAKTTETTATFTFTINPGWGVNTVICDLDGKVSPGPCTSPKTYTGLKVGEHTFTVATYAGEIGVGKDSWTWIVDSTTPDFFLKTNPAQLPLTTKIFSTSTTPVKVQIVRLGGSKGPVSVPGATKSGNAFLLPIGKQSLVAKIVPDNATNPSALTVSLLANSYAQPVIGKSFTLTVAPGSATVGSAPHWISIKYAVVNEYDLAVRGVEVTQGIQPDKKLPAGPTATYGGVTLVKDKRTVVRVYATVAAPLNKKVSGARIFLDGYRYENGVLGQFFGTLVSPDVTLEPVIFPPPPPVLVSGAKIAASFTLPPYWTEKGTIALKAKVLPASLFQPKAESECSSAACAANNTYTLVKVPFVDTGYVNIWALWLKLRGGFDPCCLNDQVWPGLPEVPLYAAQQLMPLADGELRLPDIDFRAQFDATGTVKFAMQDPLFGCPAGCSLNGYLIGYSKDLEYHQVCPGEPDCPDVVMSMIDDTPLPGNPGWPSPWYAQGVTSGKTSPFPPFGVFAGATLVRVRQPLTSVAHELGHSLSLLHASAGCGGNSNGQKGDTGWPDPYGYIHGVGVDVRDGATVYDGNSSTGPWYDFMSYCANSGEFFLYGPKNGSKTPQQGDPWPWQRQDAWISVRNWKKLQDFLALLKVAHSFQTISATLRSTFLTDEATLRVDGFLNDDGRVVLTRIRPRAGQPSTAAPSDYDVVLRNPRGGELQRWPLTVTSSEGHGAAATFLSADVPLAGVEPGTLPPGLAELQVVSGRTVLARVARSRTPPSVRVLAPNAGERVGADKTTVVKWAASDPDPGSSLVVAVDYSADDGPGWDTVYQGPNTGLAEIRTSLLARSDQARIRVRVSDGFDETSALSPRFSAVGHPPRVTILNPRSAERGRSDAPLYLAATAYDEAGVFLDGPAVTWYDGERLVARGRLASATGLTPGIHVIRAVARDSKNRTGEAAVRVRIMPSAPAIILSRAPATVSPRAHSVTLGLACSIGARLSVSGPTGVVQRGSCGPEKRVVTVPVRPGHSQIELELRAEAQGKASTLTLVFARR